MSGPFCFFFLFHKILLRIVYTSFKGITILMKLLLFFNALVLQIDEKNVFFTEKKYYNLI